MAANYGGDDTVGVFGGDIEGQLEQMRVNTIEALRKIYAVDGGNAPSQDQEGPQIQSQTNGAPDQAPICVFIGDNGRGLTNDAARLLVGRQNRINTDDGVVYSAEEHGDPTLPNKWAMVGRRVGDQAGGKTASNYGDQRDTAKTIAPKSAVELGIIANALRQNNEAPGTVNVLGNGLGDSLAGSVWPDDNRAADPATSEQSQAIFRQSERDYRQATDIGATWMGDHAERNASTDAKSDPGFRVGTINRSVSKTLGGNPLLIGEFKRLNPDVADVNSVMADQNYNIPTSVADSSVANANYQSVARGWQQDALQQAADQQAAWDARNVGRGGPSGPGGPIWHSGESEPDLSAVQKFEIERRNLMLSAGRFTPAGEWPTGEELLEQSVALNNERLVAKGKMNPLFQTVLGAGALLGFGLENRNSDDALPISSRASINSDLRVSQRQSGLHESNEIGAEGINGADGRANAMGAASTQGNAASPANRFGYVVETVPNDLVPDSRGVNGHVPVEGSQFASPKWPVDWTNPEQVAAARAIRLDYHQGLANEASWISDMRASGANDENIARQIVDMRNQTRMSKYSKDQLPVLFERNTKTYGNPYGPSYDSLLAKYGSPKGVIDAGTRSNATVNILTGIAKVKQ